MLILHGNFLPVYDTFSVHMSKFNTQHPKAQLIILSTTVQLKQAYER